MKILSISAFILFLLIPSHSPGEILSLDVLNVPCAEGTSLMEAFRVITDKGAFLFQKPGSAWQVRPSESQAGLHFDLASQGASMNVEFLGNSLDASFLADGDRFQKWASGRLSARYPSFQLVATRKIPGPEGEGRVASFRSADGKDGRRISLGVIPTSDGSIEVILIATRMKQKSVESAIAAFSGSLVEERSGR